MDCKDKKKNFSPIILRCVYVYMLRRFNCNQMERGLSGPSSSNPFHRKMMRGLNGLSSTNPFHCKMQGGLSGPRSANPIHCKMDRGLNGLSSDKLFHCMMQGGLSGSKSANPYDTGKTDFLMQNPCNNFSIIFYKH